MANEITIRASMQRRPSTTSLNTHQTPEVSMQVTQTTARHEDKLQTIGTTEETASFADIGTNGYCFLYNADATNYVEWGVATGVYSGKLKPGEVALFRLNTGKTLYLKANTSACDVRICLYAD